MDSITVKAPAKINITLDILGRRSDGYHELRSIMHSVSVYDTLIIKKQDTDGLSLYCDTPGVPCDDRNLVIKAARSFLLHHGIKQGLSFELTKTIPSMAGMGGGSSDCAATLLGLDRMFGTGMSQDELIEMGKRLGADVPFCIAGGCQICEGIGEKLTTLRSMPDCYIAVVKPTVSVSTPKAFAAYDNMPSPKMSDFKKICLAFEKGDLDGICSEIFNALEYASDCEEIFAIKDELCRLGAKASMMTGSGSAVYGIFDNEEKAQACCEAMSEKLPFARVCRPLQNGCEIYE